MKSMLTAKEVQGLMHVDRSTVYRMAQAGQIPAIKVGRQWRFPTEEISAWLDRGARPVPGTRRDVPVDPGTMVLPGVAKATADLLAGIFGVMVLVTDLDGEMLLEPSNPCGLFSYVHGHRWARRLCTETWRDLGTEPDRTPRFHPTPLGFNCARGFVRLGADIKALVVMGGVAPADWPPDAKAVAALASRLDVPRVELVGHIDEVFHLDARDQARVLEFLPRVGNLFSRMAREQARIGETAVSAAQTQGAHP